MISSASSWAKTCCCTKLLLCNSLHCTTTTLDALEIAKAQSGSAQLLPRNYSANVNSGYFPMGNITWPVRFALLTLCPFCFTSNCLNAFVMWRKRYQFDYLCLYWFECAVSVSGTLWSPNMRHTIAELNQFGVATVDNNAAMAGCDGNDQPVWVWHWLTSIRTILIAIHSWPDRWIRTTTYGTELAWSVSCEKGIVVYRFEKSIFDVRLIAHNNYTRLWVDWNVPLEMWVNNDISDS